MQKKKTSPDRILDGFFGTYFFCKDIDVIEKNKNNWKRVRDGPY